MKIIRQFAWVLPLLLAGCETVPVLVPLPEAAPAPESKPAPPARPVRTVDDDVRQLLGDAEQALAADRLTAPLHDNAFDRFQAVLMLKPGNEQALAGLRMILARYLQLAREAAAAQHYGKARALIERARLVEADNADIEALAKELAQAVASLKARQPEYIGTNNEFPLTEAGLEQQNNDTVEYLQAIARQARQENVSLLIVARSDAEGRWIYQQMKKAVAGYRLRGDIKLGKRPKILLLPPID
ncbi:hypothetical protein FKG94_18910 [Exilibacterium tricleocarpae]|uniref:Lipoprotein n=1 Tax=Exilibacterium tricleocarpae TaxID=2591008 RepID=A0A545T3D1_9GAMM|nr:hypothetical protein [Exilibacterium tricleocarpae]TQV71724.1 hypothetical protein FKG94_18910 [Exilibacterium tricleocarpae]